MNTTTATSLATAAGQITLAGTRSVNRLGFGAMRITGPGSWGELKDPLAARRVLQRAIELGVNFIDTADAYGPEISERIIFEALHPYPKNLVIATKGGLTRPSAARWDRDASPKHLRSACEGSLLRLHLDCIELYQLHAVDPRIAIADSLGELARLQTEGKIKHIGVSNFNLPQLQQARTLVNVVSVQNRYNFDDRASDDVLDYCTQHGIAFIPWEPISNHERLAALAKRRGITETQASLAWLLARSPLMLPIPGTSSVTHLEENVAAASVKLEPAEITQLN